MRGCVAQDPVNALIDAHDNFGKTHFILGYTPEIQPTRKNAPAPTPAESLDFYNFICEDGSVRHAFFSPDDHIQEKLLYLIKQEKKSIKITAYAFTNRDIAQEIANAARRNIIVELVIDANALQDPYSRIDMVHETNALIYVYDPQYTCNSESHKKKSRLDKKKKHAKIRYTLMHNKFIIFGKNIANKQLLWTGSCNWTKAALLPEDDISNQENALLTDEQRFIKKYEPQFDKLKQRATPYNAIKPAVRFFSRRKN